MGPVPTVDFISASTCTSKPSSNRMPAILHIRRHRQTCSKCTEGAHLYLYRYNLRQHWRRMPAACCLLPDCLFDWLPGWVASASWLYRGPVDFECCAFNIENSASISADIFISLPPYELYGDCVLSVWWRLLCALCAPACAVPRLCAVCLCIRLCKMDLLLGMHNFSSSTQVLHSIAYSSTPPSAIRLPLLRIRWLVVQVADVALLLFIPLLNLLATPHRSAFFFQLNSLF